tara:strand:+ start:291 stop:485 length:195 start_codon:yes stop_codon:yes gene_type:complete
MKADKPVAKKNAKVLPGAPRAKEPTLRSLTQVDDMNAEGHELVLFLGQILLPKLLFNSDYKILV